jgi:hypothetical protein
MDGITLFFSIFLSIIVFNLGRAYGIYECTKIVDRIK